MSNTIRWLPSTDADIASYTLDSGPSSTGPWVNLTSIVHNLGNAGVYDSGLGKFFYVDAAGDETTWYRLTAVDALAQTSTPSVFQVGSGTGTSTVIPAGPIALAEDLVAHIRSLTSMPDGRFETPEVLALANSELQVLAQQVLLAHEEYLVESQDFTLTTAMLARGIRIPARAMGGKARSVCLLDGTREVEIPRLEIGDLDEALGYYYQGSSIRLVDNGSVLQNKQVRVYYFARPGRLVASSTVLKVTDISGAVLSCSGTSLGATSPWTGVTIVKGSPGYESVLVNQSLAWGQAGGSFEVVLSETAEDLGVEVGDFVCPANSSPVVQLPEEYHAVLAQRVAVKLLESIGDEAGFTRAQAKLTELEAGVAGLTSERDEGQTDLGKLFNSTNWLR